MNERLNARAVQSTSLYESVLVRRNMTTKCVIAVRHGEAEHNVDDTALHKRNTTLTALGFEQAAALNETIALLKPQVIVTSPTLRTLQTTHAMLPQPLKSGENAIRVVVSADARENIAGHECNLPCEPNSAALTRSVDLRDSMFDWSLVEAQISSAGDVSTWEANCAAEDAEQGILGRCNRLSSSIAAMEAKRICLVSHGDFLRKLTGDSDMMTNCEVRVYDLDAESMPPTWTRREVIL